MTYVVYDDGGLELIEAECKQQAADTFAAMTGRAVGASVEEVDTSRPIKMIDEDGAITLFPW